MSELKVKKKDYKKYLYKSEQICRSCRKYSKLNMIEMAKQEMELDRLEIKVGMPLRFTSSSSGKIIHCEVKSVVWHPDWMHLRIKCSMGQLVTVSSLCLKSPNSSSERKCLMEPEKYCLLECENWIEDNGDSVTVFANSQDGCHLGVALKIPKGVVDDLAELLENHLGPLSDDEMQKRVDDGDNLAGIWVKKKWALDNAHNYISWWGR